MHGDEEFLGASGMRTGVSRRHRNELHEVPENKIIIITGSENGRLRIGARSVDLIVFLYFINTFKDSFIL